MNDDVEVISRLVDYHDHISTPPVRVTDDLGRGRRRVRRQRRLVAGGVALVVAAVVAAVTLSTAGGSAEHTQPIGPSPTRTTSGPAPDGLGLTAPLIAPKSLLGVRQFGFHVEPLAGFDPEGLQAGWSIDKEGQTVTLRWDEVADRAIVNVRYQGAAPGAPYGSYSHDEDVTIHGVVGHYFEEPGGLLDVGGGFAAYVAWEYAPDSWAYVSAHSDRLDPGPDRLRSALVELAEAVRAGGDPVRVPVRTGAFPSSLPAASSLSRVGMTTVGGWETTLEFGHWRVVVPSGGPTTRSVEPIAIDGGPEYPIADLRQALAHLTVAPQDDVSTWFDLKTALGN